MADAGNILHCCEPKQFCPRTFNLKIITWHKYQFYIWSMEHFLSHVKQPKACWKAHTGSTVDPTQAHNVQICYPNVPADMLSFIFSTGCMVDPCCFSHSRIFIIRTDLLFWAIEGLHCQKWSEQTQIAGFWQPLMTYNTEEKRYEERCTKQAQCKVVY